MCCVGPGTQGAGGGLIFVRGCGVFPVGVLGGQSRLLQFRCWSDADFFQVYVNMYHHCVLSLLLRRTECVFESYNHLDSGMPFEVQGCIRTHYLIM